MPYLPRLVVNGILGEKVHVFKSNAMPVRVSFVTTSVEEHVTIVKAGEDMRQDVFVLSILSLIDVLWKESSLDLRLSIYACMSLSLRDGIVEFVPSEPLSSIIGGGGGSIPAFLSRAVANPSLVGLVSTFDLVEQSTFSPRRASSGHASQSSSTGAGRSGSATLLGVDPGIMENYVCSCGMSALPRVPARMPLPLRGSNGVPVSLRSGLLCCHVRVGRWRPPLGQSAADSRR